MESIPFFVLLSAHHSKTYNFNSSRKGNPLHVLFWRERKHSRGNETLFSDLAEEFFWLLFGFFPFEDMGVDMFFHIATHKLAKTLMSFIVIWGSHAGIPRRFSKWDKLPSRMSDDERTSPKISLAPFPSEELV